MRSAMLLGLLALAAAFPAAPVASPAPSAPAPTLTTPASVIARILDADPGLQSYRARVTLAVHQTNFPWFGLALSGDEYYQQPGYYVFDFRHTPSYLKGITKVEGAALDASRWQTCYDITLQASPESYVLHMVPKINNPVARVDVTVDRADGSIRHVDWIYRHDGDHIALDQRYGLVQGHRVVVQQASQIKVHYLHAVGSASFDGFEFNAPVPTPTPTPSNPLHRCDD